VSILVYFCSCKHPLLGGCGTDFLEVRGPFGRLRYGLIIRSIIESLNYRAIRLSRLQNNLNCFMQDGFTVLFSPNKLLHRKLINVIKYINIK